VVQELYTTPLYLKGKTQDWPAWGPESVVQGVRERLGAVQEVVEEI